MYRYFGLQIILFLIITSCNSAYEDYSGQLDPVAISHTSAGIYVDVAWIDEENIAGIVDRGNVFKNNRMCIQDDLIVFNTRSESVQQVDLHLKKDCMVYSISNLQRLPNQNIGYLYGESSIGNEMPSVIRQLTVKNGEYQLSQEQLITLDQFVYSPDMLQIAATRVQGIDESKIFLIQRNGEEKDISYGFARAEMAAWSKDNVIAFFGTVEFTDEKEPSVQFYSFEKYLDYPWQLYLYDPVRAEIRETPLEVVDPGELKWSPDSSSLAFRGEIDGVKGVWLVSNLDDFENLQVARIIDAEATFDFSPDGKSLVFAYMGLQNTDKQNILYKIDLP